MAEVKITLKRASNTFKVSTVRRTLSLHHQGRRGLQGIQGEKGDTGDQGIQGVQGLQGAVGPMGQQGPKGDTGEKGEKGNQGLQGLTGPKGEKGDQGETGSRGPQGFTGPQGNTGAQGPTGAKGDKGDTGDTGPQGAQGIQGIQGEQGEAGEGVPTGGATGDYLKKASASDFDTVWADFDTDVLAIGNANYLPLAGGTLTGNLTLNSATPTITTASNKNLNLVPHGTGYVKVGDATSTDHTLNTNDDLHVTGRLEVDGFTWHDGSMEIKGTASTNILVLKTSGGGTVLTVDQFGNATLGGTKLSIGNSYSVNGFNLNNSMGTIWNLKVSNYTITGSDYSVHNANAITYTLPAVSGIAGREYLMKNISSSNITSVGVTDGTIQGASSIPLWGGAIVKVKLQSNNWEIVDFYSPGGQLLSIVSKNSAYTALDTDYTILCDGTSGAFTVTLPTAVGRTSKIYVIKKTDVSANAITVDGNGSQTIDGATTYDLTAQYKYVVIQSDGANWHIIGKN